MVLGQTRGIYTPVVFTLEDFKAVCDDRAHGKIGMWAFHSECHEGHLQCAKWVNEGSDWVIGILWNSFGENIPISPSDIKVLKDNSDVVMVFTSDYDTLKKSSVITLHLNS